MNLRIPFVVISSLIYLSSGAQSFSWGITLPGNSSSSVEAIATDAQGNVYSTGYFFNSVDFDPGPQSNILTSAGNSDIFVTKVDSVGNLIWAARMGGTDAEGGGAITVDASGNVYITGAFRGTMDADPGPGVTNIFTNGNYDVYVIKLTSSGLFSWVKTAVGGGTETANAIQVDANGHVYIAGKFSGTVDWDPNSAVQSTTAIGPTDAYVWKLNSAGGLLWMARFGGTSSLAEAADIAIDPAGVLMVIGKFTNTCDFDPSAAVSNRVSTGGYEGYLCALDIGGNYLNALTFGGTGNDYFESLKFTPTGHMYITGFFDGTTDLDPGPGVFSLTSGGWDDAFVLKLNPFGSFAWAKKIGSADVERAYSIDVDAEGKVYTAGTFNGTADFDPNSGTYNLTTAGIYDAFVSVLDSTGNFLEGLQIGGIYNDEAYVVRLDPNGVLFVAGYFQDGVDLNPYGGSYNVGTFDQDGFLVRLGACISTNSFQTISSCNTYTAPDGNVYTTSGVYTATIPNYAGCDSVITIDLTIDAVDVSVIQNGSLLTAVQGGAVYQWLDCNNNNAPIPNAVSQMFNAPVGAYAVMVSYNSCVDTSACVFVLNTGIEEQPGVAKFEVYPNPAQDRITLTLPAQSIVRITDVAGRVVGESVVGADGMMSVHQLSPGTYFITDVKSGNTAKLVKQ